MAMIRQYNGTDFVTGLRAIAATMVIMIHTGAFAQLGRLGVNLTHAGKYGVEIFFVISGFSIAVTFHRARDYTTFLTRRLFRIAPLYILVVTVVFVLMRLGTIPHNWWLDQFGTKLDAYNYLMHVAFLSCLDQGIANSIVGVEWSIPVEVFWYAALPALLVWAGSDQKLRNVLLCSVVVLVATKGLAQLFVTPRPDLFAKWFPTSYGPFFLLGVVAYRLRLTKSGWLHNNAERVVMASLAVFVALLIFDVPGRRIVLSVAVCLLIGLLDRDRSPALTRLLEFRPLLFLGTISYSLYLTHLPIRSFLVSLLGVEGGLVVFAATMAATTVVSTFLYLTIERPTNAIGKRVVWLRRSRGEENLPDSDTSPAVIRIPVGDAATERPRRAA